MLTDYRKGKVQCEKKTPQLPTQNSGLFSRQPETIDESFPKNHPLNKIFNRNTLKLSYSCMPNVQSIISSQNKTIIRKEASKNTATERNCRAKDACPLQGECQTKAVVIYQAAVTNKAAKEVQTYVGLTENTFNHTSSRAPSVTKPGETQPN